MIASSPTEKSWLLGRNFSVGARYVAFPVTIIPDIGNLFPGISATKRREPLYHGGMISDGSELSRQG
ncbi:hypothetical protein [Novosphingobium guangzhouense]|uniref:hypothetical protein n=1 Tax=Novosphingobium guangzhouense TaxID=1850347 RepID=UPI0011AFBFA3|nr:hypothetical protein [Novosphingobium guangzhouense]